MGAVATEVALDVRLASDDAEAPCEVDQPSHGHDVDMGSLLLTRIKEAVAEQATKEDVMELYAEVKRMPSLWVPEERPLLRNILVTIASGLVPSVAAAKIYAIFKYSQGKGVFETGDDYAAWTVLLDKCGSKKQADAVRASWKREERHRKRQTTSAMAEASSEQPPPAAQEAEQGHGKAVGEEGANAQLHGSSTMLETLEFESLWKQKDTKKAMPAISLVEIPRRPPRKRKEEAQVDTSAAAGEHVAFNGCTPVTTREKTDTLQSLSDAERRVPSSVQGMKTGRWHVAV